ncbi:MAG: extracellular solute-binding protein [Thermotogota bacterium]|nr:extracellular solute-binding protein [Thermotogota bacterium]
MKKFVFVALCFVLLFSFASAKTVEIWSWRTQDAQVWQEVQKNLKAKGEDITIDFRAFIPTEYDAKLFLALQGGTGPDIAYIRRLPGGRTQALVEGNLIKPLNQSIDFSNFSESVQKNVTMNAQIWGVPFAVQVCGIFYNEDIFKENKLSEPKTWDEMLEICKTLKTKGIDPFFCTAKEAWTLTMQHAMCGVSILGPAWIKRLSEGKVDFLDQDWIYLQTLLNDLKVYYQDGYMGNDTNDMNAAFAFGQAAMVFYGAWGYQTWKELNPDINVGYFMVPPDWEGSDPYSYIYMDGAFGLTSIAKNPTDAIKILKYTATPEFGTIFTGITANIPAVSGAVMPDIPLLKEVMEAGANHASPYVYWVGSPFVVQRPSLYDAVLSPGMQAMYMGQITPAQLAQQAQDALSQWFEPLMRKLGKIK